MVEKGANNNDLSLSKLWKIYCSDLKMLFNAEDKKKLQLHDWSLRPLEINSPSIKYAAHDSFFLIYIAYKIL